MTISHPRPSENYDFPSSTTIKWRFSLIRHHIIIVFNICKRRRLNFLTGEILLHGFMVFPGRLVKFYFSPGLVFCGPNIPGWSESFWFSMKFHWGHEFYIKIHRGTPEPPRWPKLGQFSTGVTPVVFSPGHWDRGVPSWRHVDVLHSNGQNMSRSFFKLPSDVPLGLEYRILAQTRPFVCSKT